MKRRPRFVATIVPVALALTGAPAGAHPGHAYEEVTVQADARAFAPQSARLVVDQGVLWRWQQGALFPDHTVTADSGQTEEFDSGERSSGTYLHVFRKPGTYSYHCTVHPGMTGTVEVRPQPGKPPRLTRLRVGSTRTPTARFRLSKGGSLIGRIATRKPNGWRDLERFARHGRKGRNRLALPVESLDPGRYRLELTAYDLRGRNDTAKDRFRL
jgi:plastocyanin